MNYFSELTFTELFNERPFTTDILLLYLILDILAKLGLFPQS